MALRIFLGARCLLVTTAVLLIGASPALSAAEESPKSSAGSLLIIDTHAHIMRNGRGNASRVASRALQTMDAHGIELTILLPPPFPSGHKGIYGRLDLAPLVTEFPSRFAFVAGGESLNGMIHSVRADQVTSATLREFEEAAEAIAKSGAVGLGEIAIEHFSSGRGGHPYESVPADHPLLFALVDIAARLDLPVDIHMEALPQNMAFPGRAASANPPQLMANIAAFERLLEHNRRARIIWAHAGWDLTLERSPPLMQAMLFKNPNLYMSVKVDPEGPQRTSPLGPDGNLKPGWLAMLRRFPDRFVIGSDQFLDETDSRLTSTRRFVDSLPPDIAPAVARVNAQRIYRLETKQPLVRERH